jgi:mannose-6-phosphate isomerase-like protein (cupin superfamily)
MTLGRGHRLTLDDGLSRLPTAEGKRFVNLLRHGTLQVEVYAPRGHDPQQPHDRDEVYVVATGSGTFYCDGQREPFGPGDFLFVPAGVEHRFEGFTDDLAVWVLFYGPVGGEATGTAETESV